MKVDDKAEHNMIERMEKLGIGVITTNTTTKVVSLKAFTSFTGPAASMMHGKPRRIDLRRLVPKFLQ